MSKLKRILCMFLAILMLSVIVLPLASGVELPERYRHRITKVDNDTWYYHWPEWNEGSAPFAVGARARLFSTGNILVQDTVLQWRLFQPNESGAVKSKGVLPTAQGQQFVGYGGILS